MPAAVKLQEEFGDDLQVIFVESQNSGFGKSVGMATKSGWLGNQAIWTNNYLFSSPGRGLPAFALLDGEGKVVISGSSNSMHGQIVDNIERMIKEKGDGPEGVPSSVAKVYADLGKGAYAKAMTRADKVLAKPGSKDTEAVVAAAEAARAAVQARFDGQLVRAEWLLANGYPLRAKELTDSLLKGAKGNGELLVKANLIETKLASEDFKADIAAAKALAKIENALFEDGGSDKLVKKLKELSVDSVGSPVAKRAEALVDIAKYSQM
ncbi:MAG: hypothetical protein ACYTEP_02015 [Planctomycetota bacterium]